jgi:hypothetical protein
MLPPETEKVWRFLKEQTALSGFILIGGTALTMRINHRRSEDLDLVYPHERLPRERLESVGHLAHEAGLNFVRNDHESAVQEFAQGGLELHDYQQDFLAEGIVKVSFFVADPALEKILSHSPEPTARPASLAELFKSK